MPLQSDGTLQITRVLQNINKSDRNHIVDRFSTFTKNNFSGGFSIRLLTSSYPGPAINVRRGSDSALLDFYADEHGNLSTEYGGINGTSLVSWLAGSAGYLKTFYDQSGNGRHITTSGIDQSNPIITPSPVKQILTSAGQSSAKGMFAVFRVSSTYTGPTMTLRRSSDSNIQDFYADVLGNLGFSLNATGSTYASWASGTIFVTKWWDQSGTGNHAIQSTTTLQPVFRFSNNSPMISFNTTRWLQSEGSSIGIPTGTNPNFTIIPEHNFTDLGPIDFCSTSITTTSATSNNFTVAGTSITLTAVTGTFAVGMVLTGTNISSNPSPIITAFTTGSGAAGSVCTVSISQTNGTFTSTLTGRLGTSNTTIDIGVTSSFYNISTKGTDLSSSQGIFSYATKPIYSATGSTRTISVNSHTTISNTTSITVPTGTQYIGRNAEGTTVNNCELQSLYIFDTDLSASDKMRATCYTLKNDGYNVLFGGSPANTNNYLITYRYTTVCEYPFIATAPTSNTFVVTGQTGYNGTYTASSSSSVGGSEAYRAFQYGTTVFWSSNAGYNTSGVYTGGISTTVSSVSYNGEWLQIQLPVSIVVKNFSFFGNITTTAPRVFILAGSNNGSTWTLLYSGNFIDWFGEDKMFYTTSNTTQFSYYRIIVQQIGNLGTTLTSVNIGRFRLNPMAVIPRGSRKYTTMAKYTPLLSSSKVVMIGGTGSNTTTSINIGNNKIGTDNFNSGSSFGSIGMITPRSTVITTDNTLSTDNIKAYDNNNKWQATSNGTISSYSIDTDANYTFGLGGVTFDFNLQNFFGFINEVLVFTNTLNPSDALLYHSSDTVARQLKENPIPKTIIKFDHKDNHHLPSGDVIMLSMDTLKYQVHPNEHTFIVDIPSASTLKWNDFTLNLQANYVTNSGFTDFRFTNNNGIGSTGFNGIEGYFDLTGTQWLDGGSKTFNISTNGGFTAVFMVISRSTGTFERIFDFGSTGTDNNNAIIAWRESSTQMSFTICNASGTAFATATTNVNIYPTIEWACWAVRYTQSNKTYEIFKNGRLEASAVGSVDVGNLTCARTALFYNRNNGVISNLSFSGFAAYDKSLSLTEIGTITQYLMYPVVHKSPNVIPDSNLVRTGIGYNSLALETTVARFNSGNFYEYFDVPDLPMTICFRFCIHTEMSVQIQGIARSWSLSGNLLTLTTVDNGRFCIGMLINSADGDFNANPTTILRFTSGSGFSGSVCVLSRTPGAVTPANNIMGITRQGTVLSLTNAASTTTSALTVDYDWLNKRLSVSTDTWTDYIEWLRVDVWHSVAIVITEYNIIGYNNGVVCFNRLNSISNRSKLMIGSSGYGITKPFYGYIKDIKIYDYALSEGNTSLLIGANAPRMISGNSQSNYKINKQNWKGMSGSTLNYWNLLEDSKFACRYSGNNITQGTSRIQDYKSFRVSFDFLGREYGADCDTFFCGTTGPVGRADFLNWGNGMTFLLRSFNNFSMRLQINSVDVKTTRNIEFLRGKWHNFVIIYNRSNINTWIIMMDGVEIFNYSNKYNEQWVATSGNNWGFSTATGGLSHISFIKNFQLDYEPNITAINTTFDTSDLGDPVSGYSLGSLVKAGYSTSSIGNIRGAQRGLFDGLTWKTYDIFLGVTNFDTTYFGLTKYQAIGTSTNLESIDTMTNSQLKENNIYLQPQTTIYDQLSSVAKGVARGMYDTKLIRSGYSGPTLRLANNFGTEQDFYADVNGNLNTAFNRSGQTFDNWYRTTCASNFRVPPSELDWDYTKIGVRPYVWRSNITGFTGNPLLNGRYISTSSSEFDRGDLYSRNLYNDNNVYNIWHTDVGSLYNSTTGAYTGPTSTTVGGSPVTGEWAQLELPNSVNITSFSIMCDTDTPFAIGRSPKRFVVASSTDGSTWTTLYTTPSDQVWVASEYTAINRNVKTYAVTSTSCRFLRFIGQSTQGGVDNFLTVKRIFYNANIPTATDLSDVKVATWYDQSGTVINCTQHMLHHMPRYNTVSKAIEFDTEGNGFAINRFFFMGGREGTASNSTSPIHSGNPSYTLSFRYFNTIKEGALLISGSRTNNTELAVYMENNGHIYDNWFNNEADSGIWKERQTTFTTTYDLTNRRGYIDGSSYNVNVSSGHNITVGTQTLGAFYTDSTFGFRGTMKSAYIFSKLSDPTGCLSDTDRTIIEQLETPHKSCSVELTGYFRAPTTDTWSFAVIRNGASTQSAAYGWIGSNAQNGYTVANSNFNSVTNTIFSIAMTANVYYPIRVMHTQMSGNSKVRIAMTPSTMLLDSLSSAGKASCRAAYALYRVNNSYTGAVVELVPNNNTGVFQNFFATKEGLLTTTLNGSTTYSSWLATNSSTFAYVSVWYDQSGNSRNATQSNVSIVGPLILKTFTILSVSTGTTCTVTTSTNHTYVNGNSITITEATGVTGGPLNGTFTISGVTANTFTITVTASITAYSASSAKVNLTTPATIITTASAHTLITGNTIHIVDSNTTPSINNSYTITVLTTTTFSIPVNLSAYTSAGALTFRPVYIGGTSIEFGVRANSFLNMGTPGSSTSPLTVTTSNPPFTIVVKHGFTNNIFTGTFVYGGNSTTSQAIGLRYDSNDYLSHFSGNDFFFGSIRDGNVVTLTSNGTTRIGYVNNQLISTINTGTTNIPAIQQYIGRDFPGNEYNNGQINTIFIFDTVLDSSDRAIINNQNIHDGTGKLYSSIGTLPSLPAESAKVAKDISNTNIDGIYYINVNGTSTPIYCLMNDIYDGGGWMMLMKGSRGTTFSYSSNLWTTRNTLNPTDLTLVDGDAKYNTYNYSQIGDIMAIFPDIQSKGYTNVYGVNGGSHLLDDGWCWKISNWHTASTPLLQELSNEGRSNARGIYALFRANMLYTGPIIRVRNSANTVTTDFYGDTPIPGAWNTAIDGSGTSYASWYITNGASSSVFVHTWYDQSGLGHHATQTTNASQPSLDVPGGPTYINFSGTLFLNAGDTSGNAPFTAGTNLQYTVIYKHGTFSNSFGVIGVGPSTANQALRHRLLTGSYSSYYWNDDDTYGGAPISGNTVSYRFNNNVVVNRESFVNGTRVVLTNGFGSSGYTISAATQQTIGRTVFDTATGQLQFLYVFGSAISDSDRRIMESGGQYKATGIDGFNRSRDAANYGNPNNFPGYSTSLFSTQTGAQRHVIGGGTHIGSNVNVRWGVLTNNEGNFGSVDSYSGIGLSTVNYSAGDVYFNASSTQGINRTMRFNLYGR